MKLDYYRWNYEKNLKLKAERGEWKSVPNLKAEIKKHQEYARKTLKKDKRINIRISSKVLEELQANAIEDGMPYQTPKSRCNLCDSEFTR